ncbi:MAG: hypothetical protein WAO35_21410 [Terriglobia bacterium]
MTELHLTLIGAPDDPPLVPINAKYQNELESFSRAVEAQGLEISSYRRCLESGGGGDYLVGEFLIKVVPPLLSVVGAIGAWLKNNHGRRVRLKVGEIEAEAPTVEEVEKLLKQVPFSRPSGKKKGKKQ